MSGVTRHNPSGESCLYLLLCPCYDLNCIGRAYHTTKSGINTIIDTCVNREALPMRLYIHVVIANPVSIRAGLIEHLFD
jgi:hypothetical protein